MGEAAYLSKHKVDLQRSFTERFLGHRNDRQCIWSCSYHCNVCYHLLDVSCHCYAVEAGGILEAFTFVIVFGLLCLSSCLVGVAKGGLSSCLVRVAKGGWLPGSLSFSP
uniref:Uncharacterized protein n=1 Tax=Populus trichocarpa TaxID=3694 RepID=A0A3N7FWJ2_POPTR